MGLGRGAAAVKIAAIIVRTLMGLLFLFARRAGRCRSNRIPSNAGPGLEPVQPRQSLAPVLR